MERRSRNHIIIGSLDTTRSQQDSRYAGKLIESEREQADVELMVVPGAESIIDLTDALISEKIDLFVSPAVGLPVNLPRGAVVAGAPLRADVRSALVSRVGDDLRTLPEGTRIGVCAPSDQAQIAARYPGLTLVGCVGEFDDRLGRYLSGEVDAMVVSVSDLSDAGKKDMITSYLLINDIVPPAGQGTKAFVAREGDEFIADILGRMGNKGTFTSLLAERMVVSGVLEDADEDIVVTSFARSLPDGSFRMDGLKVRLSGADLEKVVDAGLGAAWDFVAERIVHNLKGE